MIVPTTYFYIRTSSPQKTFLTMKNVKDRVVRATESYQLHQIRMLYKYNIFDLVVLLRSVFLFLRRPFMLTTGPV